MPDGTTIYEGMGGGDLACKRACMYQRSYVVRLLLPGYQHDHIIHKIRQVFQTGLMSSSVSKGVQHAVQLNYTGQ